MTLRKIVILGNWPPSLLEQLAKAVPQWPGKLLTTDQVALAMGASGRCLSEEKPDLGKFHEVALKLEELTLDSPDCARWYRPEAPSRGRTFYTLPWHAVAMPSAAFMACRCGGTGRVSLPTKGLTPFDQIRLGMIPCHECERRSRS